MMLSVWLVTTIAVGSPAVGTGPQLYRLSGIVGDTIDVAERNQYRLFPGVTDFQSAVVHVGDSLNYQVEVTAGSPDSIRVWTAKLTPTEVERLRFIIDNPDHIEQELATNEYAGSVMDRFWTDIQSRLVLKEDAKTRIRPGTAEGRIFSTAAGVTAGACLGGVAGAAASAKLVSSVESYRDPTCLGCLSGRTNCGITSCGEPYLYEKYTIFTYSMDAGKFALISGSIMGACAAGSFFTGLAADRRALPEPLEGERKTWRTALSILGGIGGAALGVVISATLMSTLYGRVGRDGDFGYDEHILENQSWVTIVPAIISGVGVTIEAGYIGYVTGRSLDRGGRRPKTVLPRPRIRGIPLPELPPKPGDN
jgi:hypothetical protein